MAMTSTSDILIIGGGPAGLMAAAAAAGGGRRVLLCERLAAPGRKLLVTGGGRCNLTTSATPDAVRAAFGRYGRFLEPALRILPPEGICAFFAAAGVPTVTQADGSIFPVSQQARDVLDVLQRSAVQAGVTIRCDVAVRRLIVRQGTVAGVETEAGEIAAARVILAAGGCAYAALGSDGSGHRIARDAGLEVVAPVPALVPLVTVDEWPRQLAGLVAEQARVWVETKGRAPPPREGPVLFTHRGVSGPPVLDGSGEVAARLAAGGTPPVLRIAWRAERDSAAWRALFERWRGERGGRALHNLLAGELPARLAEALCTCCGVSGVAAARARRTQLEQLAEWCGAASLPIAATEGWSRAMVTRGGVALDEVDPHTLGSRRVAGLYFAGEVLDLDGPCGGYNLTWAFASGRLAGSSAAG